MKLRSFKLQLTNDHVRIVVETSADVSSAVDLLGAQAQAAFALAGPLLAAVGQRNGSPVRAVSVDLRAPQLLATCGALAPGAPVAGVSVVRITETEVLDAVFAAARPLLQSLLASATELLRARGLT